MSNDTIAKMQSDLANLRSEKSRIDASINEIESALKVIARYASSGDKPVLDNAVTPRTSLKRILFSKPKSKQEQIFEGVLAILNDGFARPTDYILKELTARGVEVGGENPEANLSAYLSRAKDDLGLNADRRAGWSLKK